MDAVGAGLLRLGHLLTQAGKVRREDRWSKFHRTFVHIPSSSWLQLSGRLRDARPTIRYLSDTPVIACLGGGRLKDALNGCIQQGVVLGFGRSEEHTSELQ